MNKKQQFTFWVALGLIIFSASNRVLNVQNGIYNFAPVAAVGLFAGAVIKEKKYALLVTLLSMFISDIYIALFATSPLVKGFYGITQFFVYGAFALITLMGSYIKRLQPLKIAGFAVAGSLVFFILSNLGCFVEGMYGYTVGGFVKTFAMALPFFKNSLEGDLIGTAILFGSYALFLFGYGRPQELKA